MELLHAGWVWEGVAQGELGILSPDDLEYLWLPLSHSFGKTLLCGSIAVGLPTYVDGRIDKIAENLPKIKPTIMCGAPRIYEKLYNGVNGAMRTAGGAKYKIFKWAFKVGKQGYALELQGKTPTGLLKTRLNLADRLVFSKIRERLGGRIRFLVSGAAPLNKEIAEFFHIAGLTIYEGYGLTETSAVRTSTCRRRTASARSAGRWRTWRSASPETARSSCAVCPSCGATTTCPRRRPPASPRMASSRPATSARSTPTAS